MGRAHELEGAIALAGGEAAQEQMVALRGENVTLRGEVGVLRERVEELERRLSSNSGNSSKPPSSDEPKSRAERRRLAKAAYKRSMKKSGAQNGHQGNTREQAAAGRVDDRVPHLPELCGCGHQFDGSEEHVGDPVVHQQWELPPMRPLVIEHARCRLRCPDCQTATLAVLPGGALSAFGPSLQAHIGMLAGVYRLSRRQTRDLVTQMLGVPISLGGVDACVMRMSAILADPWEELRTAIQRAQTVHMDETSWRLAGAQQYLWVAASSLMACFRIDPSRSQKAAKALIGEHFAGIVISDRYAGYHFLALIQQQLCWCHVLRQFVDVSQRPGAAGKAGSELVALARQVLDAHREYLRQDRDAVWLSRTLGPLREQILAVLERCCTGEHEKTANFANGLIEEYPALWTFAEHPDLDIAATNNAAERAVRHAVLTRKIQGGTQSEKGSRWIERIQSTRETCRLQEIPVLGWLIRAATAAHHGLPVPTLLPAVAHGP